MRALIHTHYFVKQDNLTTSSILQLFRESVEMKVTEERPKPHTALIGSAG
jgi:hypothetical protein